MGLASESFLSGIFLPSGESLVAQASGWRRLKPAAAPAFDKLTPVPSISRAIG
jgi:hypothetical protein